VYGTDVAERLQMVCSAMRLGHRPSQLLNLSSAQLETLIQRVGSVNHAGESNSPPTPNQHFLDAARTFNSSALLNAFSSRVAKVGLLRFAQEDARQIVETIGSAWASGTIEIEHEHFIAEALRDFLAAQWRALNINIDGPSVVCGTLPGEQHGLGLQFVASCLVANEYNVLFLGTSLPPEAIASTVREHGAVAVAISVSSFSDEAANTSRIRTLRQALPAETELWIGGEGSAAVQGGDRSFTDLGVFCDYISGRQNQ